MLDMHQRGDTAYTIQAVCAVESSGQKSPSNMALETQQHPLYGGVTHLCVGALVGSWWFFFSSSLFFLSSLRQSMVCPIMYFVYLI